MTEDLTRICLQGGYEGEEATEIILKIIRDTGKPLTTREVQAETDKLRVRCPDSTVVFLKRLRINGLINGERKKSAVGFGGLRASSKSQFSRYPR